MRLISTPEAAERLGVTVARVQHLIWAGRLPAQKVGRDYVIQEDDLKLVENRKIGRPPQRTSTETGATGQKRVSNSPSARRTNEKKGSQR